MSRRLFSACFAFGLLVAACGDDGSLGDDGAGADVDADVGADADADADLGDLAEFLSDDDCAFLLSGAYLNPLAGLAGGVDGDISDSGDLFERFADNAPSEIKAEMTLVADRLGAYLELIADVDFGDASSFTDPAVQKAFAEAEDLFDDDYTEATAAIDTYLDTNCQSG